MNVQELNLKLSNILIDTAKKTFPLKRQKTKRKNKGINGYNKDCAIKRQEYHKAKSKNNRLKTNETHQELVRKSRAYKKEVNKAKAKGRKDFIKS